MLERLPLLWVRSSLSHDVGSLTPFVMIGYRAHGDSDVLELDNRWAFSPGSGFTVGSTSPLATFE